eukprot:COSAG01_NODE_1379_length_10522_cov_25.951454_7_plen_70_part_00
MTCGVAVVTLYNIIVWVVFACYMPPPELHSALCCVHFCQGTAKAARRHKRGAQTSCSSSSVGCGGSIRP